VKAWTGAVLVQFPISFKNADDTRDDLFALIGSSTRRAWRKRVLGFAMSPNPALDSHCAEPSTPRRRSDTSGFMDAITKSGFRLVYWKWR